jgi:hypothetical protein
MMFRALVMGVVIAALAAAPASAQAPVLAPLKPCYVAAQPTQREFVDINARNFTPLAEIDIFIDDILQSDTTARAAVDTTLKGSVQAPWIEEGQRLFSLRLTERAKPMNTVSATSKVTRLAVEQSPDEARTGDRVRFRGRGFTTPLPVYAHYVFAGRSRKTVRIGMPHGDCGLFSVRRKQFPFKRSPRRGVWTIWFDQERIYNPRAQIRVPLTITVKSRIKPEPARAR